MKSKFEKFIDGKFPLSVMGKLLLSEVLIKLPFLLPDDYTLADNEYKIYLNLKESGMMIRRFFGVYEYWNQQLLRQIVKPGMTVVDVGANKGDYSLLSAYLMKDRGKILAVEPVPENCYWLRKSIKANNFKSIKVCELALSDKNGKAKLYLDKKISGGASLEKFDSSCGMLNIRVQKMDDLIKNKVDVIKIDVQGTELEVLKGVRKVMKRNTHIFIDLDNPKTKIKVWKLLKDNGYRIYSVGKDLTPVDDIRDVNSIYGVNHKGLLL